MDTLLPIVFSGIIGLGTLAGSIYVARRYQKLGGGVAQEKLNVLTKELSEALEEKVKLLSADLVAKQQEAFELRARLLEVQQELVEMRRSRLYLQQDVDDLHAQVRELRRQTDEDRAEMRSNGGPK